MNHNASFLAAKSRRDEYVELLQNNPVEFWIQQVEIAQGGSNGPSIKLRAAVEAISKDAARLDWIERQDLSDLVMGLLEDQPNDGDYFIVGDKFGGNGPTLRAAIDAAMAKDAT